MSSLPRNLSTTPATELPVALPPGPMRKRWTREEYHRLATEGWFQNQRVELIDGEVIEMSPQSPEHYLAIERVRRCLEKIFGSEYWVRSQGPVTNGEISEPEPDLCVVKGTPEDYTQHPREALLVIEVSKTSLKFDSTTKLSLYASMGVPDYWVLDLENRQLLVHRQPRVDGKARFGYTYQQTETITVDGQVTPLESPATHIAVADMLPPVKKA